jgi:hypothetical protein
METIMIPEHRNKTVRWLLLLGGCLVSVGILTHCAAAMAHGPVHKQLTLPVAPEVAYHQATAAMATMGARMLFANGWFLSGEVLNVVILTVMVHPVPEGSMIDVTGSLLPNRLALGSFDEVDQYLALLR